LLMGQCISLVMLATMSLGKCSLLMARVGACGVLWAEWSTLASCWTIHSRQLLGRKRPSCRYFMNYGSRSKIDLLIGTHSSFINKCAARSNSSAWPSNYQFEYAIPWVSYGYRMLRQQFLAITVRCCWLGIHHPQSLRLLPPSCSSSPYTPRKIFQHHEASGSQPFKSLIQSIITSMVWLISASNIGPQNCARMSLSNGLCHVK
jgi:hypothetical protein